MDIMKKLEILSNSAKYDASCSSSGSNRKNTKGGIGNAASTGICHSWSQDGRCISLLKILYTNKCIYDCKYCINRASNDLERTSFTPKEVVDLTINFYRRNYIEGLFLSSGVERSPDYTMENLVRILKDLRLIHKFNGYIHVKAIPGSDPKLIYEAGLYADRMSVNIELPSEKSLKLLAPQKNKADILKPMRLIKHSIIESNEYKKKGFKAPRFTPGGQSTQIMVGATNESDLRVISLTEGLYNTFGLKRVYYSAYVPVVQHANLPAIQSTPPILKEHRMYQADWLLRYYGFKANELLDEQNPNFDINLDPKAFWALNNLDKFPLEVNNAPYETLLRVPGIGVTSALRIIKSRRLCNLSYDNLKKIGVVLKRARYFITCSGKFYGDKAMERGRIKNYLLDYESFDKPQQMSLFTQRSDLFV
ncbi:putative DNA modification/repair radical SAM protein [Clostridium sp. CF011]|uniref:putative DNA modification/repair radical SAM protein n=1 Tax=unclassified Clostridium TaxID=2614128 RepID=UPI001C0D9E52|nr:MULTISPECIES: putative DNA modification/repair radical SAM protein [unclassified Clostridium]MBU3091975.1 putative DNA modification/repair radical SAM protein [Clostridium sp. CF011]MBW9145654.1 putative DNA modification/repair radical SAM protein [Clostridium sp. CM027]UVE41493.1 putative DNA modification/repair radical SAM protein [Clostridium sp. CM027]WAG70490.1 putative DNA modification/repair radical SAM protein [Clostridium sp. CF011]